jgi:hypothetical protein
MTNPPDPVISGKLQAARERMLSQCPTLFTGIFARAYGGAASPREAIKAKCLECIGFERAEITRCTSWGCPLWPYRPYQKA